MVWPRGYQAEPYLRGCFEKFVIGKGKGKKNNAFINMVENSISMSEIYERNVQHCETALGIKVKNLHLAKHRADSTQVPVGRFTITFDALCMTARDIAETRDDLEAEIALGFLTDVEGESGAEAQCQMGMLGDSGDEAMLVQRFTDDEDLDLAEAPFECQAFIDRVQFLFLEGGCKNTGYTKVALDNIKNQKTFIVKNKAITVGLNRGLPDAVFKRCLQRMGSWTKIAISVLKAEFPDFELLQAFQVLSLHTHHKRKAIVDTIGRDNQDKREEMKKGEHCERLSLAFDGQREELRNEIEVHRPLATNLFGGGMSQKEAWCEAWRRTQKRPDVRLKYTAHSLGPCLLRWKTWFPATTGCEGNFAVILKNITPQQRGSCEETLEEIAKVTIDRKEHNETEVIAEAQKIWVAYFGKSRAGIEIPNPASLRGDSDVLKDTITKTNKFEIITQ